MGKKERVEELTKIAPELVAELKVKEKEKREPGLPELPLAGGERLAVREA